MQAGKNNIRRRSAVIAVGILVLAIFIGIVFVQPITQVQLSLLWSEPISDCPGLETGNAEYRIREDTTECYITSIPITGIVGDAGHTAGASGSDNWPTTWADDDHIYTAYGDGWGFDPQVETKLSMGWARVEGPADNWSGINIRSDDEQTGNGASGKKASGMLSVDGRLWMWVRNANEDGEECELWYSDDHAASWIDVGWNFTELGYCAFINFEKDYAGARDNYVYMTSPDTNSAYNETDDLLLLRVPKDEQTTQTSYEYFTGTAGSPAWGTYANRQPILTETGAINRHEITYSAPLGRYIMTMRARGQAGGLNHFSLYEAPKPWGPWTLFHRDITPTAWGESQRVPSKWISKDGLHIYLVYSGNDKFTVRGGVLITD